MLDRIERDTALVRRSVVTEMARDKTVRRFVKGDGHDDGNGEDRDPEHLVHRRYFFAGSKFSAAPFMQ